MVKRDWQVALFLYSHIHVSPVSLPEELGTQPPHSYTDKLHCNFRIMFLIVQPVGHILFFLPLLCLLICFLSASPARQQLNSSRTLLVIALFRCKTLSTSEDSPSEANSLPTREISQCLQHPASCLPYDTPTIMLQTPCIQPTVILNA